MSQIELYKFLDEYECNMTAKRHYKRTGIGDEKTGTWDMRISHSWFNGPILSSCGKATIEECINDLAERLTKMPDSAKTGIKRKNEQRTKKYKEDFQYDDTDEWIERIY